MGFIKLPSYHVFDYKPRTYDPEFEKRREILRQYREEQGKDMGFLEDTKTHNPGDLIRAGFKQKITMKRRKVSSSTIRLAIFIVILSAIAYIILVADLTPIVKLISR
jgi:hypothetical protein